MHGKVGPEFWHCPPRQYHKIRLLMLSDDRLHSRQWPSRNLQNPTLEKTNTAAETRFHWHQSFTKADTRASTNAAKGLISCFRVLFEVLSQDSRLILFRV